MSGSNSRPSGLFGNILKFTGLSAVAGILAMALLAPAVAVGSFAVSAGISIFDSLPPYIKPVTESQASSLYAKDKDGKDVLVASFYHENRISVQYNEISPNVRNAVVATEDPRFFEHGGVDLVSLIRAGLTNVAAGGNGPGGSTITMQYVKNSLVEAANISGDEDAIAAATAISIDRKLREMRLAIALEQVASKQDILAGYLNLAFFGNQINGIEAAANYYFGKKASELDIPESAMLAAMLKSPNDYKPDVPENLERAKNRRDYVINNMVDAGYISSQQADEAKATPIKVNLTHTPSGCEANQTTAFFCDFVVWTIRNSTEFGPTPEDRETLLRRGGLDIHSTLDLELQSVADKAVKKYVPLDDPSQIGSATVSVEPGTGKIKAMAENRIFDQTSSEELGHTAVNYASDRAYGGSSGFQSGSTYKVFTLAEWLTKGFTLSDHIDARVKEWNTSDFKARCTTGGFTGTWAPKNDSKAKDDVTALQATAGSINTAFASMAQQLDLCDIRDTAMRFGVHRADGDELVYYPSSILGINELSPLTMAAAMAGISNKGVFCTPIAIESVTVRATKSILPVPQSQCSEAVTPEVAAGMTYAMQRVISGGTGGASSTGDGTPLAGKTGTTDSGVHTWMTGFSTAMATATWVGNVVGTKSLRQTKLNGKLASTVRHDIWRTIMQAANKVYKGTSFAAPPASMLAATGINVPDTYGLTPEAAVELIKLEGLNAKIVVTQVASNRPVGTVAYTRPARATSIARGSIVKIYVSKGGQVKVPSVAGLSVADAKAALLAAGFSAVSEPQASQGQFFLKSPTIPKGLVVGTQPAAGTSADITGAILLLISLGP